MAYKRFGVGDQVALKGIVRLVDKAGDGTVTIELQSTGQRVTVQTDSAVIDLVEEKPAKRPARRKGPLFDVPD